MSVNVSGENNKDTLTVMETFPLYNNPIDTTGLQNTCIPVVHLQQVIKWKIFYTFKQQRTEKERQADLGFAP